MAPMICEAIRYCCLSMILDWSGAVSNRVLNRGSVYIFLKRSSLSTMGSSGETVFLSYLTL